MKVERCFQAFALLVVVCAVATAQPVPQTSEAAPEEICGSPHLFGANRVYRL